MVSFEFSPLLRAAIPLLALYVRLAQGVEAANAPSSAAAAASLACARIRSQLSPALVQSSGPEYNATATGPWNLFNSVERPTCIVYPRLAAHVQVAMQSIFHFESDYALQSGSHSAMIGYNSITDGVLISFAHMNSTTYNPETTTATVLPRARWNDALDSLQSFGVAVLGARATNVGVGGLLIGGGISYLSPMYGWAADNIKEMDVVLVTGELVTASATNQYADLFRALKGGASRFGIVTRFELYTVQTGTKEDKNWFGGSIVYPHTSVVALSNATARFIREETDPKATFVTLLTASGNSTMYLFYHGASLPPSIFGEFLSIPSTSQSLSPLSYYDVANFIDGNTYGSGEQFGASSWVGDETLFLDGFNHFSNFSTTFANDLSSTDLVISPIPRSMWTSGRSGPNAIGPDPGVNYAAINYYNIYPAGVTSRPANVNDGFKLLLAQTPRSKGLPLYINECDASQNIYETYPGFATLKQIYEKYDPTGFIVKHTVGPSGL